jgi:hypothetical protein
MFNYGVMCKANVCAIIVMYQVDNQWEMCMCVCVCVLACVHTEVTSLLALTCFGTNYVLIVSLFCHVILLARKSQYSERFR